MTPMLAMLITCITYWEMRQQNLSQRKMTWRRSHNWFSKLSKQIASGVVVVGDSTTTALMHT